MRVSKVRRLKEIRKEEGFSSEALAELLGISRQAVNDFENRERPNLYHLGDYLGTLGYELRIIAIKDGKATEINFDPPPELDPEFQNPIQG